MNTTLQRYNAARQPLEAILDAIPADRWSADSPCDGWSARDVVRHLIETQLAFCTGRGLDAGAATDADAAPATAWRTHAQRMAGALHDDELVAAGYEGFFGPTTVGATLEQFYIWDMLVHRWDVATAAGLDADFTEAELDSIEQGADSFGDALHMDGICKPALQTSAEDRTIRVLARLGRSA